MSPSTGAGISLVICVLPSNAPSGQSGELAVQQGRVRTEVTEKAKPREATEEVHTASRERHILFLSGLGGFNLRDLVRNPASCLFTRLP
jgi:hypothetical protein